MTQVDASEYQDFISADLKAYLLREAKPVPAVPGLLQVGEASGLETTEALTFLCKLWQAVRAELAAVLTQRQLDRRFIDQRTKACAVYNQRLGLDPSDREYASVLGLEDARGRIVFGPKSDRFAQKGGAPVAPLPEYLQGPHVTLFGPPDSARLAINAMNALHRKLPNEPRELEELLHRAEAGVKWGADNEDSKTPLREDLVSAGVNLKACFDGSLRFDDGEKRYAIADSGRALPIKRFPGLALPALFLYWQGEPLPLHLYDFALHAWHHAEWSEAMCFYVPKLENEEEARYIHHMVSTAERLLQEEKPGYKPGTIRLMIVLENPRAILRTHEIIEALHPYFAGASLGWHDYLASTARLFKHDPHYRIPVKADPEIVIKHIRESHLLLSDVVGSRGGIKVGGMYGILPLSNDPSSPSFQQALQGFFRDVITQLRRGLDGFWIAHPDFVRIGVAVVVAWRLRETEGDGPLLALLRSVLQTDHYESIVRFLETPDIAGMNRQDPHYLSTLLVSNLRCSDVIANHDPAEVRYNVFQSLQYLADWLAGHGCVALPTELQGEAVRVMDDLATAERSRWEVWAEIAHGRFSKAELLQIAHEELSFIRKDKVDGTKRVQVKWDARTERWYPIALRIMLKLMTAEHPPEFATELLLPFTMPTIRTAEDPWALMLQLDRTRFALDPWLERAQASFEACGALRFAKTMAEDFCFDRERAAACIRSFSVEEICEAAAFHGDIGEAKQGLDAQAKQEQARVSEAAENLRQELQGLGRVYRERFGFKFLVSAQGRSAEDLLALLKQRLERDRETEIDAAREALWAIAEKRLVARPLDTVERSLRTIWNQSGVAGVSIAAVGQSLEGGLARVQSLTFGEAVRGGKAVRAETYFELASLSKTLATAFALEFFAERGISLSHSVQSLLEEVQAPFRLKSADGLDPSAVVRVTLRDIMSHTALGMHYVKGFPSESSLPRMQGLLSDPVAFGYDPLEVLSEPGKTFRYSGGGFLVLEYLLEALAGQDIGTLTRNFFDSMGCQELHLEANMHAKRDYAAGYFDDGSSVPGGRLAFPACAAGGSGTARAMLRFLQHLGKAYHRLGGSGGISHDTAVRMLEARDRGAREFMGSDAGIGIFVLDSGPNRWVMHQGANEGFRALYLYCFAGPDADKGFVLLANGDNRAVLCLARMAQEILRSYHVQALDPQEFQTSLTWDGLRQEEIVNVSYKELVLRAFAPKLPEAICERGPLDPLAGFNILSGARITKVSNQRFARAENLISPHLPCFDPELYGSEGKIMDSWESARHNPEDYDSLELELASPRSFRFISLSTQFHDGNQFEAVQIFGRNDSKSLWIEVLAKTQLAGHAWLGVDLGKSVQPLRYFRVVAFPDGGLSRLGLYEELPAAEQVRFKPLGQAVSQRFAEAIPKSHKPMTLPFAPKVWRQDLWPRATTIDFGSSAWGAKVLRASNEHYGPASQVVSPFPPLHMFDGLESRRSRGPNHHEELEIKLACPVRIERIVLDFTYFVNNNPRMVSIARKQQGTWVDVIRLEDVKAFAANRKEWRLPEPMIAEELLLQVFPDGGVHRIHIYGEAVKRP